LSRNTYRSTKGLDFAKFNDNTKVAGPIPKEINPGVNYDKQNFYSFAVLFYKFKKKSPFMKELMNDMIEIIVTDPSDEKSRAAVETLRKLFQDSSKHDL
jgi:hypothetical protein